MSAPANELQAAVFGLLSADDAVAALVEGRVYDLPPTETAVKYPYITFGVSDESDEELSGIEVSDHSLQIDVWSQKKGGSKECKAIAFAVKKALHDAHIDLETHAASQVLVSAIRYLRDPDGITSHGAITVEAEIEER